MVKSITAHQLSSPWYSSIFFFQLHVTMEMSLEALIAIIALITGLPPAAVVMWRWVRRGGRRCWPRHRKNVLPRDQISGTISIILPDI